MSIKADIQLGSSVYDFQNAAKEELIEVLHIAGLSLCNSARDQFCPQEVNGIPVIDDNGEYNKLPPHQPYYIDRTGNLRSSIQYGVVEKGTIVLGADSEPINEGMEGVESGRALLTELASRENDIALYLVAGMNYAKYLEDLGYSVLAEAKEKAFDTINEALNG